MVSIAVTVVSAYNLPKKCGLFDKTDPYVQIQVGAQKQRTTTKEEAGSEAEFNEVLTFAWNGEPEMIISVYDDEKKKDELLGSNKLEIDETLLHRGFKGALKVFDKKDREIGEVCLHIASY